MCKFCVLVICSFTTFAIVTANCYINLSTDIQIRSPVILVSSFGHNYKLFKPSGQVALINNGANLLLACPTVNRNKFVNTDQNIQQVIQLTCDNGNFIYSKTRNRANFKQLLCQIAPMSMLQITGRSCANGQGVIYETGFNINQQFYGPVFEICYDNTNEYTYYTHNTLNGAAMAYAISTGDQRRTFTADGMNYITSQMNKFYQEQKNRFISNFGVRQNYVDNDIHRFLARGHLSADADFIFPYEKLATYFYVNTAPEFQTINTGNWLRVEELARAVSISYQDDIESYNGYISVLALPRDDRNLVEIYLDDIRKIEVPIFFYKILLHKASDSAIVFLTVNNPYLLKADIPKVKLCTDVCQQSGLIHPNFPDETKGYTFFCELNEFKLRAGANWLPAQVMANNLLKHRLQHG
ncbi:uncharacterized protein LOC119604493 [Lucilia sericata]|uniref:uncharacterized protein LOC119604493 n=1 Tax=Lucilia sericata TaxID=13632 RepID=UPI0018A8391E|nr:uncharacterized protein LOC119604493 [Lucilia sericata]